MNDVKAEQNARELAEIRAAQQRIIDMLTHKCVRIDFDARLNDHDMREMFSCIIAQTLCVDVIAYTKADDYVVTLHVYYTNDSVYGVTYLSDADFSESAVFEVIDFADAMRRINEVVTLTHDDAI